MGVPKPTLRFWEKAFVGILAPTRSDGGQRRYTARDIEIISEITRLKDEGRSLSEIGDLLSGESQDHGDKEEIDSIDILARRIADAVTIEVSRFLEAREFK